LLRSSADHPTLASFEDERSYQLHLAASGAGVPTLNQSVSTLRFLFRITLARADIVNHNHTVDLPTLLSPTSRVCPGKFTTPVETPLKLLMVMRRTRMIDRIIVAAAAALFAVCR
jgi:hypothetical protein